MKIKVKYRIPGHKIAIRNRTHKSKKSYSRRFRTRKDQNNPANHIV